MKYAKLIDGDLVIAPRKIKAEIDGEWYNVFNPPAELLEADGWLPVIETEMPGDAPEGYHYEATYTEESGEIVQGWELVENEYSDAEAFDMIFGGDEP